MHRRAGARRCSSTPAAAASCRAATDIELLLDVLTGAIYGRLRECPDPLDADWVRRVIRLVLSGVGATRPAQASSRP